MNEPRQTSVDLAKAYDIFHIYDHDKEESFQIVSKSKFIYWLNDHADRDRYSFFTTYSKLKKYIGND